MSTNQNTTLREFIIVGQDQGTGFELWDVAPAPTDNRRRAIVLEEIGVDADDAFGSVNLEWATSPRAAVNQLITALRDQSGLDDYDLTPKSQTENLGPEEPMPATTGDILREALTAADIDSHTSSDTGGSRVVVPLPCGAEIWIADESSLTIGGLPRSHAGWAAHFYSTVLEEEVYTSTTNDLTADTQAVVEAVTASLTAERHHHRLPLGRHITEDIARKVHPHLPDAAVLTLDATDCTLTAVLDESGRTIWYAPASPLGLPDDVTGDIERLARLLLRPGSVTPVPGHDDTCEITLARQ
ncbi:hypothetical protein ACH4Q7_22715 [Streptomyces roseolus]|uniref:hypothetical protein n=1 Tax=Streptomyces roseolus TaxID=67358 RepID=UPI0037A971D6